MMIEYLILFIPLIWEVSSDLHRIKVKKKPDNHKGDLLPRFGFCVLSATLMTILGWSLFLPALIHSICLFAVFFDPIMGLILHKNPFYKSPDSKTDQFILKSTPLYGEIFTRLWILGVGIGVYHYWHLVV